MKIKFQGLLYTTALLLSMFAWVNYVRFVIITTIDSELSIKEYDKKYFHQFPNWLNGIEKMNLAIVTSSVLAILLIIFSGYLTKKYNFIAYIILIMDAATFGMISVAYM